MDQESGEMEWHKDMETDSGEEPVDRVSRDEMLHALKEKLKSSCMLRYIPGVNCSLLGSSE